ARTGADRVLRTLRDSQADMQDPQHAAARRATYQDDRAATLLVAPQDADAAHCCPAGSAPGPSPTARARLVRGRAPSFLRSRTLAPQTARSPAYAAGAHQERLRVLAAPPSHLRSQRFPIPRVRLPTHPRGHWPSSWPNPGVRLVATPPPHLLYHCDTMPSSSSS